MSRSRIPKARMALPSLKAMRVSWGGALGALLVLLICVAPQVLTVTNPIPRVAGGAVASGGDERAEGYNALIDDLVVARGWLEMRETGGGYAVVESPLAPDDPVWQRFKRESYLFGDLRAPERWRVSDYRFQRDGRETIEIVGVDPSAHQVAGPFNAPDNWRGGLLYRPGTARVVGLTRRVAEAGAGPGRERPMRFRPNGRDGTVELFGETPATADAAWRYRFRATKAGCVGEVASVMRIGTDLRGDALVRLRAHPECRLAVRIGGRLQAADGVAYARLRAGETLTFEAAGPGGAMLRDAYDYGGANEAISPAPVPGARRTRAWGLDAFSRGVETLVAGRPGLGDIETTLDARLQDAAETVLGPPGRLLNAAGLPARASITLMDANTGEVLAIASRPQRPPDASIFTRAGMDDRNHNFTAQPVGSVAKAPITMAILQAHRELAGLKLTAMGDFKGVVGVEAPFRDTVSGDLDMVSFLARSSNRYAVGLMLLALSDAPAVPDPALVDGSDCYAIGVTRLCRPPMIETMRPIGPSGPDGYRLEGRTGPPLSWGVTMNDLFGALTEFEAGGATSSANLWPGLAETPKQGAGWIFLEEGNLGLNDLVDLHRDYLMSILGGNRTRWSSIKVAEIVSRMVTRRPVNARLTQPDRLPLPAVRMIAHPAEWNLVLQGMEAVTGRDPAVRGTAARLRPSLPPGDYRVFAKTGTPTLEIGVAPSPARAAAVRLAERQCGLTWDPERRRITAPITMRPVCADIAGQAGSRASLDAALGAMSPAYRSRIDRDLLARPHAVTDLTLEASAAVGVGHGIALVIGRYPSAVAEAKAVPGVPPYRALAIVINLESHDGEAPATDMAGALLASAVVRAWLVQEATAP
ncbi:hypothetical protein KOAAANKH_03099 [Brevundimonas sp. NIBR10]|uniref:penicillin-binding transpeptidase domain-containing protein n=1 Tax=Brevundimonas sp. NIBR10 TaxID=3015997 RepID=UPI0022F1BAE5|nr:penicillin-binding transpeptidase domain-containing protein [Brevundimonas sp. NIBR10]WGM48203.1 hypothetical protein KOAAANKH_03099 [Brevundimonas sp. NIBR10]